MNFGPFGGGGGGSGNPAEDAGVKAVKAAMESCAGKSVMSGVMGFGMGGVFGLFMASVRFPLLFCNHI